MPINRNLTRFAVQVSPQPMTCDTWISSVMTTTANGDVVTVLFIGRATGAARRRAVYGFSLASHIGRVSGARIKWNVASIGANAAGRSFMVKAVTTDADLVVEGTTGTSTGVTWSHMGIGTDHAWSVAGTDTSGSGTAAGHNTGSAYATFANPTATGAIILSDVAGTGVTTPSAGSLDDVINEAMLAALENGWEQAILIVADANEAGTAATNEHFTVTTKEGAAAGDPATAPSVEFTLYPSPLDGWLLECAPQLALPSGDEISVGLRYGPAITASAAGFSAVVGWGASTSEIPTETTASQDFDDFDPGEPIWFDLETTYPFLEKYGFSYYRVQITGPNAKVYTCPYFRIATLPRVNERRAWRKARLSDDHFVILLNGLVVGGADPLQAERRQAHEHTMRAIGTACDSDSPPSICIHDGDGPEYTLEPINVAGSLFPLADDGSGLSDSGTSHIILSQDDANEVVRSWLNQTLYPCEKLPLVCVIGNHAAFTADMPTERDWTLAALRRFRMIAPAGHSAWDTPEYDSQSIGDQAIQAGTLGIVNLNAGYSSASSGTPWSDSTDMESYQDWVLTSGRLAWLNDTLASLKAAGVRVLEINIHHTLGGANTSAGSDGGASSPHSQAYGRSDFRTVLQGYFGDSVMPVILTHFAGASVVVRFGHDHTHDSWVHPESGVTFVWHAMPSARGNETMGGPYAINAFASGPQAAHAASPVGKNYGNAGWYLDSVEQASMTIHYINARTVTSPTDFSGVGAANPRGISEIPDGSVVTQIRIGATTGEGARPVGARPLSSRPGLGRPSDGRP